MKKEHTVIITIGSNELLELVNREARRTGLLKDIKSTVEYKLFEPDYEVSVEYNWEEVE